MARSSNAMNIIIILLPDLFHTASILFDDQFLESGSFVFFTFYVCYLLSAVPGKGEAEVTAWRGRESGGVRGR